MKFENNFKKIPTRVGEYDREENYNDDLAPQTIFLKARTEDTQVQMWILVRDYFGGVDWQHLRFDVVGTP